MFSIKKTILVLLVAGIIPNLTPKSSILAEEITVLNHSFENPTLGDGGLDFTFPSWSKIGPGAITNPTTSLFPGEAPDGSNIVLLGGAGAIIEQALSAVLSYGTYQLDVDFGQRLDVPFAGYGMSLLAGGSILVENFSNLPTPGAGEFLTATKKYLVAPGSANEIAIGSTLSIRFLILGNSSQETGIDNVRLSSIESVPEPGCGITIAAIMLCAFTARRASKD